MTSEVVTQIVINAPAREVWGHLMDFEAYPGWNPVLRMVEGMAVGGARLRVQLHLPGSRPRFLKARVECVHTGREMIWVRRAFPGLLESVQCFMLEPLTDEKTQFVQRQLFSGLLVPLLWPWLRARTRRGLLLMNSALKHEVEKRLK